MKFFLAIFALLFGCSAFGQTRDGNPQEQVPECKGVVHGTLFGQDGKPWGGINLILDPPGDFGYVLPQTKSNDRGDFRFEEVCNGVWGVFVQDEKADCPFCDRYWNKFLYGSIPPDVKITDTNLDVQVDVHAPPRPGTLTVRLLNSETKATIPLAELELRVNRKRWIKPSCDGSTALTCVGGTFAVPPDIAVKLRIRAKGFHEWKDANGRGRILRIPSGGAQTIVAELDPMQDRLAPTAKKGKGILRR